MKNWLLAALMMAAFGTSHADFSVISEGGSRVDPVAAATSAKQEQRRGGLALGAALKHLAPEGWKGYSAKGVDNDFMVEVDPRLEWYDALSKMATRYNLNIKADPNEKTIFVSEGPGGMRDLEEERRRIESAVVASERQAEKEELEGSSDFVVKSGQKLSEALHLFLKKGDWKMEWEAGSDFVVKQGYSVTGKSLRDVLDAALTPFGIHAVLYTVNRVAVVRSNAKLVSPNAQ